MQMLSAEFIESLADLQKPQKSKTFLKFQNIQTILKLQKNQTVQINQKFQTLVNNHSDNSEPLQPLSTSNHTSTGSEIHSEEYQKFLSADPELKKPIPYVIEVQGNIFEIDPNSVLTHCVSADFKMSKGLALAIRRKFGQVTQLRKQKKAMTEIASIEAGGRTILHLVTKEHYWQKPTYQNLFQTFQNLMKLCTECRITQLNCPRLSYGLDEHEWENVRSMLRYIFWDYIVIKIIVREELLEEQQARVIQKFHENPLGGHQGIARTYQRISKQYQLKGMRKMIKDYVLACAICI